jgi:hypothetical protein
MACWLRYADKREEVAAYSPLRGCDILASTKESAMHNEWTSRLLTRELSAFSRELDLFQDEALIWATAPGISNSAGTLTLHVCGNLQYYVGSVLGNTGYVRDRDLEFSARNVRRPLLQANLARTAEVVRTVLADLPDESLAIEYPDVLGGPRMPTGLFLRQLSSHLAFHLGQAGYLRRILTGANESSGALAIRELSGTLQIS